MENVPIQWTYQEAQWWGVCVVTILSSRGVTIAILAFRWIFPLTLPLIFPVFSFHFPPYLLTLQPHFKKPLLVSLFSTWTHTHWSSSNFNGNFSSRKAFHWSEKGGWGAGSWPGSGEPVADSATWALFRSGVGVSWGSGGEDLEILHGGSLCAEVLWPVRRCRRGESGGEWELQGVEEQAGLLQEEVIHLYIYLSWVNTIFKVCVLIWNSWKWDWFDFRFCCRKNSETWTAVSSTIEDGHAWRKYGQKEILNAKFPRYIKKSNLWFQSQIILNKKKYWNSCILNKQKYSNSCRKSSDFMCNNQLSFHLIWEN